MSRGAHRSHGYSRKRDANEPEIVKALIDAGASVYILEKPVDLVVGYKGITYLLEVKNGSLPPSQRRITPEQREFLDSWNGQVMIVINESEALAAIGADQ